MSEKIRPAATRADWKTIDMPEKNSTFVLTREFTAEQIAALRHGNIPREMEDKWFWFMEGDTLYAHRSWTGVCVYRIDFSFADNRHTVTVNQDPDQIRITSVEEDRKTLDNLLNWWSQSEYDHYGEWISETVDLLKKAGKIPKDAEDYRREGLALEQEEKYEEAFLKYEEAAKMDDAPSMICIARMYLTGEFRPVTSSNLAELLLQGGPIFPWSLQSQKVPDYKSGLEWLMKAADLGNGLACETVGNMLCNGMGCKTDIEKGVAYLEKAVAAGQESAVKYVSLYRPDGKTLNDEEYEICLDKFIKAADTEDDRAYALYATLKSGTQKQLARLGHILIAAQNIQKSGYEAFKFSLAPSGIPLLPVASKRRAWKTFLRFNMDAWTEEHPLIAVASDILDIDDPRLLEHMHHAKIVGIAEYKSPAFGWLREKKEAVLLRLGEGEALHEEQLKELTASLALREEEYRGDSVAFLVENGEKEYSFEVAGIHENEVEVLWRYTIGGSNRVDKAFEPELVSLHFCKSEADVFENCRKNDSDKNPGYR